MVKPVLTESSSTRSAAVIWAPTSQLLFGPGFAGILSGTSGIGTSPIYYGPGNGADTILESEAVPIDASTVTQLWVQTKNVPGPGHSYTFQLCVDSVCDSNVTCTIDLPNPDRVQRFE